MLSQECALGTNSDIYVICSKDVKNYLAFELFDFERT